MAPSTAPSSAGPSIRLDRDFAELLRDHRVDGLNEHDGVVYGLFADYTLGYMNPAWFRFAQQNGGEPQISRDWPLHRSVLDCADGALRGYLASGLDRCLQSGETWEHEYECSSAAVYRLHHQIVYPLADRRGLLVVNSPVVERPHDPARRPPKEADDKIYADANGLFTQCSSCRRMRNYRIPGRWDWVPEWIENSPQRTSHTFCPTCFGYYFPAPSVGRL